MNLVPYMKAGYVPLAFCRPDVAANWVKQTYETDEVELQGEQFIIEGFLPSKYYYENGILFKKEAA